MRSAQSRLPKFWLELKTAIAHVDSIRARTAHQDRYYSLALEIVRDLDEESIRRRAMIRDWDGFLAFLTWLDDAAACFRKELLTCLRDEMLSIAVAELRRIVAIQRVQALSIEVARLKADAARLQDQRRSGTKVPLLRSPAAWIGTGITSGAT